MTNAAVVPVKTLTEAKKRLSNVLSADDRRRLVLSMLNDVLHSLKRSSVFDEIIVVSPDGLVGHEAERLSARFVRQIGSGLNSAIRQIANAAIHEGVGTLTCVLADIPLVEPRDFRQLERISHERPRLVLSPSFKAGTNVMTRAPPNAIAAEYGRWSYAKHLRSAQQRGIPVYSVSNERLSLDIDTPEDLRILRRNDNTGHTNSGRFVRELLHISPVPRSS